MTTSLRIPLHSFIDLITNSSSETFVAADRQTVSALEDIIDVLLLDAGSDKKCHDLFRIGLDTEDGGYGHYKVIYVEAREPRCRTAAKALEKLREAFTPRYQEDRKRDEDRYIVRANTDAPRTVEDAVNAVLDVVKSDKTAADILTIDVKVVKVASDEFEEDELKLVVEAKTVDHRATAAALENLNDIFTAENVSNEY